MKLIDSITADDKDIHIHVILKKYNSIVIKCVVTEDTSAEEILKKAKIDCEGGDIKLYCNSQEEYVDYVITVDVDINNIEMVGNNKDKENQQHDNNHPVRVLIQNENHIITTEDYISLMKSNETVTSAILFYILTEFKKKYASKLQDYN